MIHKGLKGLSCEHCAFTCKRKSDLNSHLLTPTRVILFTCSLCNFTCNSEIKVRIHIAHHMKDNDASERLVQKRNIDYSNARDLTYQPDDSFILKIRPRSYCSRSNRRENGQLIEKSDRDESVAENITEPHVKNECWSESENTSVFDPSTESYFSMAVNCVLHCKLCQFSCPGLDQLGEHFKTGHLDVQLPQCKDCGLLCLSSEQLVRHSKKHLKFFGKNRRFQCENCSFSCSSSTEFKCHRYVHLNMQPFSCPSCTYTSMKKSKIEHHILTHYNFKTLLCCHCNYRCRTVRSLKQHMNRHTKEMQRSCPHCDFRSMDLALLEKHLQLDHDYKRPLVCELCSFTCWIKTEMTKHKWTHTGRKFRECTECDYKCRFLPRFRKHMLIHKNAKPYKCSICSHACRTKPCLKSHMDTHAEIHLNALEILTETVDNMPVGSKEPESTVGPAPISKAMDISEKFGFPVEQCQQYPKQLSCTVCPFECDTMDHIKRHACAHTTVPSFKCDHCGYTGRTREYLLRHMKRHSGAKPFACKLCSYNTYEKGSLNKHFLIHTGFKPHKCQYCDYATRNKSRLNEHLQIHSNVKPFLCSECGGLFRRKSKLHEHMFIHMEKNVTCALCSFRCRRQVEFKKHMLKKHSNKEGVSSPDPKEPKSYICEVCGFSCKNYSALRQHVSTHTVGKP